MTKVYFERNLYAEQVATFVDDETYLRCLPELQLMAKERGFDRVTESVEKVRPKSIKDIATADRRQKAQGFGSYIKPDQP